MPGRFYTVGMGPGDPELLSLKAARIIGAVPVVAYFAKGGRTGHARRIAGDLVSPGTTELRFEYPWTTEIAFDDERYVTDMAAFYAGSASRIATHLEAGEDVALLCEGDPFFYGSAMYLFDRLAAYPAEIIPGIPGMSGCWARARTPITHGDDVLTVLPGTLDEAALTARLIAADAAVIMKVGRNLPKIRAALDAAGLLNRAVYVERGTMEDERVLPLASLETAPAPYFSMILVPGRQRAR